MEAGSDAVERQLHADLASRPGRIADEDFCHQLYRALASTVWIKDGLDGEVALSWSRAEEVVNDLRANNSHDPLVLAQTGGEGEISGLIDDELGRLGWSGRALDTAQGLDSHVGSPTSPPRHDAEAPEWERRAHEEADQGRLRRG
jgi:hypothetical protein